MATTAPPTPPLTARVAGFAVRHPKRTLGGWLLLVVLAVLLGGTAGDGAKTTGAGESGRAQKIINEQDVVQPYRENVLIQPKDPKSGPRYAQSADLRRATADVVAALRATDGAVEDLASPLDGAEAAAELVSKDGRSGLVTFTLADAENKYAQHYDAITDAVTKTADKHPDVRVVQAGDATLETAVDEAAEADLQRAELGSLPLTLVILLVVFGSLVAAGIPVLLSASAVLAALGLLAVAGTVIPANSTVSSVVLLIGMAVGVDYSLFYLRRAREERAAGSSAAQSLDTAARTSGHVVVVSGLTVMLSVGGLFLTGIDIFNGMAVGTVLVVGLSVVGSLTALPALLALLGNRVDALRVPFLGRRRTTATESRTWTAVARGVVRRPLLLGGGAAVLLALLAAPALGMKLADPGQLNALPRSIPAVDAAVRVQEAFPGGPSPAQVVVSGKGATDGAADDAVADLRRVAASGKGVIGEPISTQKVGDVLVVKVPLAGKGTDQESVDALKTLRAELLPDAFDGADGISYAVTGETAAQHDFATVLEGRAPWVIGFVLAFAFVILTLTFRSPLVAVASVLLNVLSVGAAYGVVVLGFQEGGLAGLLGFESYGGVVSWLPLFMFVILFGLSMDYHVFILSRTRELWQRGESAHDSVIKGIGGSAGVVTSAAVIMIAVFALFATLSGIDYKMLGVGMAVAIALDATVVRGVLLPSALALLGDRAWGKTPRSASTDAALPHEGDAAHEEPSREPVAAHSGS